MLQQSQLKGPKKKSYPLVGEAEMADELNKIERSRPTGYRTAGQAPMSAPKKKPAKGRDMPLPSSDGIMGTFTNFFKKK
jgi:hypothetical protein